MEEIDLNNKEEHQTEEEKKNEADPQKQNWSEKRREKSYKYWNRPAIVMCFIFGDTTYSYIFNVSIFNWDLCELIWVLLSQDK